ncbi:MAG: ECF transporter S component [Oscillospiraceae bacterium]|nr:ECF transporter S component [Oscillospiraceae bacterium]
MSTTTTTQKRGNSRVRKIAVVGMLTALAEVLMILDFPLPMLIPGFVKMDFSELPALVAAFVISPLAGGAVCLLKNVIHLFFTTTGGIGEVCNFLLGAMMVLPAGFIYKYRKTRGGAVIACLAGCLVMALSSILINYYISYPVYFNIFAPEPVIIEAYQKLNPAVNNLWDALIWFNAPFTFAKGFIVSVMTFIIYKPLSNALKKIW